MRSGSNSTSRFAHAFALLTLLLCADGAAAQCKKRELRARSTDTITLDSPKHGIREHPAFYLLNFKHDNVLFFKPEDVVRMLDVTLEAAAAKPDHEPKVLERLRQDLPLREDTDLFKYAIHDAEFAVQIDYLVARLLDDGHVTVDYWPLHDSSPHVPPSNDQYDPATILRVHWSSRGGEGRSYCDPEGFEIFSVVDTIND